MSQPLFRREGLTPARRLTSANYPPREVQRGLGPRVRRRDSNQRFVLTSDATPCVTLHIPGAISVWDLPVSLRRFFEDLHVHSLLGHQLLQSSILFCEGFELLCHLWMHPTLLLTPTVIRLVSNPKLCANFLGPSSPYRVQHRPYATQK